MDISKKAEKVAKKFLKSDSKRSFKTEDATYVLEFERDEEDPKWLACTTWGYDYAGLKVPQTYAELVNLKMRAQLGLINCGAQQVGVRFYMDIMREVNP